MTDPSITGHVRLDVSGLVERLRFARAVTSRQISRLVRDANARLRGLDTSSLTTGLARVAGMIGSLGRLAAPVAAAGAAIGGLVPIVAGLTAALADILPASALAVSGVLAIGLAAGTLKIAMSGVGDAVKAALDPSDPAAYAEALKKLSPNARGFVEAIRRAQPALDAIKKSVQDRVFDGLGKQLAATGTVALPVLRRALDSTATTLNRMGKGALTAARTVARDGTLGTALKGATDGLNEFRRLPGQIVTGLTQIGAAAAPAFARLSKAGGSALDRLAAKLTKSFESGGMERAIEQAITLIGQLGRVIGNVGSIFGAVFGAAQQTGGGFLSVLESVTAEIARIAKTESVQKGLRALVSVMSEVGSTAAPLLGRALQIVADVFTELGPPAKELVRTLGNALGKILKALGPVLKEAAKDFGKLVVALLPLITLFGDLISDLLPVLTPLFKSLGDVFEQAAPFIRQLAENIAAQLTPVLEKLPDILTELLPPFTELTERIFPILTDMLKQIGPDLGKLSESFAELLVTLTPLVTKIIEFAGVMIDELAPIIVPIIGSGIQILTDILRAFTFLLNDFVIPSIKVVAAVLKGDWKTAQDIAIETAQNLNTKVSNAFARLVTSVRDALSRYVAELALKARDGAARFLAGIARMAGDVTAKVREIPGRIKGALGNLGGLL
ncbi:hypothetical protein ACWD6K_31480, partial [Streptomyces sp. NPDC002431]